MVVLVQPEEVNDTAVGSFPARMTSQNNNFHLPTHTYFFKDILKIIFHENIFFRPQCSPAFSEGPTSSKLREARLCRSRRRRRKVVTSQSLCKDFCAVHLYAAQACKSLSTYLYLSSGRQKHSHSVQRFQVTTQPTLAEVAVFVNARVVARLEVDGGVSKTVYPLVDLLGTARAVRQLRGFLRA